MANERRLIDANPIVKFITDGLNNPDKMKAFGYDAIEILAEIEYAPTVDAVEVVHGRWVAELITNEVGACPYLNGRVGDKRHNCVGAPFSCPCEQSSIWGKSTYHCSECGLKVGYREEAKTNYCPNCGAKMNGERRTEE